MMIQNLIGLFASIDANLQYTAKNNHDKTFGNKNYSSARFD